MARVSTTFKPGQRPESAGRKAGTKNKISASLRDTFLQVFEEMQEDEDFCLKSWAQDNPTEFYKIISKLLPQEYTGDFYTVIEVKMKDDDDIDQEEIDQQQDQQFINDEIKDDDAGQENDFG